MADHGDFADLVEMTPAPLRPVARRLREIILAAHPEACVVVRPGDRAATFGTGPRKMREGYCYILPQRNWVNLGFYRGTALADPQGLLDGSGKTMRHVKIRSLADCEAPALTEMIRAAWQERRAATTG